MGFWGTIIMILIMVIIGTLCGLFFVKVLKKPMLGHLVGGIIIGIIGAVLGGFFLYQLEFIFKWFIDNPLHVNFFYAFAGGLFFVWIFSRISHQE
jgi:uncharacterized membrane protein YeaQ/YmgE (transglycosylase-associated protein family)